MALRRELRHPCPPHSRLSATPWGADTQRPARGGGLGEEGPPPWPGAPTDNCAFCFAGPLSAGLWPAPLGPKEDFQRISQWAGRQTSCQGDLLLLGWPGKATRGRGHQGARPATLLRAQSGVALLKGVTGCVVKPQEPVIREAVQSKN